MNSRWIPLSEQYDTYAADVEAAIKEGLLDDPETAERIIYPPSLHLGEGEKGDIRTYIEGRTNEIVTRIQNTGEVNGNHIANLVWRSLLSGMLWERERIGH